MTQLMLDPLLLFLCCVPNFQRRRDSLVQQTSLDPELILYKLTSRVGSTVVRLHGNQWFSVVHLQGIVGHCNGARVTVVMVVRGGGVANKLLRSSRVGLSRVGLENREGGVVSHRYGGLEDNFS